MTSEISEPSENISELPNEPQDELPAQMPEISDESLNKDDDVSDESPEKFDPETYVEPVLDEDSSDSTFSVRTNNFKKGTIDWIREEHSIVSEHLEHIEEEIQKLSLILKLDFATVRSARIMLKEKSERLTELTEAQDSLNVWIAGRQSTYAWQLLDALNGQRLRIKQFENEVQAWCDTPTDELYEASVKMQKRFKRKLKWGISGVILSFAIGSIVNWILQLLGLNWISKIYGVVAPLIGLKNPFAFFPVLIGGLSFGVWISAFTSNFRAYLKFRRRLQEQVLEARFYLRAVKDLNAQKGKIASLHGQVQDYLVFMAEILHRPWRIADKWLDYETSTIAPETLPTSLVVAKPLESGIYQDVVKRTIETFSSGNWRTLQVETLFSEFEKLYLMSSNSLESRVNVDHALRERIESDLETSHVLSSVGDLLVIKLAKSLQKTVLPQELGFHVGSVKPDVLLGLELGVGAFAEGDSEMNWHSFVTSILGDASAWSNLAFSFSGVADRLPLRNTIRSYAFVPERLLSDVRHPVEGIVVQKDDDSGIEVVVRVDLSSWLEPEKVSLFDHLPESTSAPSNLIDSTYRSDVVVRG